MTIWQITGIGFGLVLGAGIFCLPLITVQPAIPAAIRIEDRKTEVLESTFLEQWIGEWEGTGTSDGRVIRDRMRFQWVLDRRFLRFTYQALTGDQYQGEGYVWYNPQLKRYEWWEFNNGSWPVRHHVGDRHRDQLILEENASDRKMRLVFTFKDSNTLEMTEALVNGEQVQPYVVMEFKRLNTTQRSSIKETIVELNR